MYSSAYAPTDFIVGAGFARLAGTVTLQAGDPAEEGALQAFHRLLQGDSGTTMLPFDREWNGGVFPTGTVFGSAQASDTAIGTVEASTLVLNYTLPSGSTTDDVDLGEGSHLTLGADTLATVALVTAAATATTATVTVFPQVTAGATSVREAVVKARLLGSQSVLRRGPSGVLLPIQYAWRQVA